MAQFMLLSDLIDTAIATEDTARKVYLGFTYKFSSQPEVADFWQTMADDESVHARILSSLRSHVSEDKLHVPIDARLAEMAQKLKVLDARALVNSIHTLDDAYKIAYELESSEANTIFNFLTIRYLPTDESYDIINATIDRHLLRLAEFSRQFGDVDKCQHIAVGA
jgi:rubrerythrin